MTRWSRAASSRSCRSPRARKASSMAGSLMRSWHAGTVSRPRRKSCAKLRLSGKNNAKHLAHRCTGAHRAPTISPLPPAARSTRRVGGYLVPRLPLILLSALTLTLGGCFMSSDALIKPASADYPWSNLRAQQFKWSDGKWQAEGYVSLRREGPNYRLEDERTRDVTRFLAHQIGDNRYVVQ